MHGAGAGGGMGSFWLRSISDEKNICSTIYSTYIFFSFCYFNFLPVKKTVFRDTNVFLVLLLKCLSGRYLENNKLFMNIKSGIYMLQKQNTAFYE